MPPLSLPAVRAAMLEKLRKSLLTERHAKLLHMQPMTEEMAVKADVQPAWAGFKLPYFTPTGKLENFYRYRFWPDSKPSKGWSSITTSEKPLRYTQPKGSELHIYMPPILKNVSWADVMQDEKIELDITEGELKSACVCSQGRIMLGLGGVFSWTSRKHQQAMIPIMEKFKWAGRRVNLAFDSDRSDKPLVQLAASRLALALLARGAELYDVEIPATTDGSKQGVDDFIAAEEFTAYEEMVKTAKPVKASLELHRFNDEVAVIWAGGPKGGVVRLEDGEILTPVQFTRSLYRNRTYMDFTINSKGEAAAPKLKYAADEWLAWPARLKVHGITYAPGQPKLTPDEKYNLYRPSFIEPCAGDISKWEELLRRMFGELDPEHLLWLKRWFAYPLQHPGTKMFSCVLVWSRKGGTGKNLLAEALIPVYGAHNCITVQSDHLMSEFNSWAEGRQFVIGDEITLDDKRHTSGKLKSMLTNRTIRINRKGIEAYEVPDCANYWLTSNDPVAVVLDQGERRTFVHHAPETPLGDAYGREFMEWLYGYKSEGPAWDRPPTENGGAHAVAWQLLHQDLGDFSPTAEPPDTQAKLELIDNSRSDINDWVTGMKLDPVSYLVTAAHKFDSRSSVTPPTGFCIYTPMDLLALYDPEEKKRTGARAMGIALDRAGFRKARDNNGRLGSIRSTFWLIKESEEELKRAPISGVDAAEKYKEERLPVKSKDTATEDAPLPMRTRKFAAKKEGEKWAM